MRHILLFAFVFCLMEVHAQPLSEVEQIKKADEQLNGLIKKNRANDMNSKTAVLTGTLHQKGVFKEKAFEVVMLVNETWIRTEAGCKLLSAHASINTKW